MRAVLTVLILALVSGCATTKKVQAPPAEEKPAVVQTAPTVPTTAELLAKERFNLVISGFDKRSASLPTDAAAVLNEINKRLAAIADISSKDPLKVKPVIRVTGHCDKTGTPGFNQALSLKRAQAVAARLNRAGFELKIEGRGYSELADPDQPDSPKNRRVEVRFD